MHITLLKSDALGRIELCQDGDYRCIRRDTYAARRGLRAFARWAGGREARSLAALGETQGLPSLLAWKDGVLLRSYLDGEPMQRAQPRDPEYFRAAHRLLRRLRACGVAHNDLAKEPNWLVLSDGSPGIVDFQLATLSRRRGRLFRLLAREDLRHMLKHKRTYCPDALTPTERRVLAKRSWITHTWHATGKRVYKFVARRLFGYWDNEGEGRVRD